jgi:hypothetical protein
MRASVSIWTDDVPSDRGRLRVEMEVSVVDDAEPVIGQPGGARSGFL